MPSLVWRVERLSSVESTNTLLAQRADAGAPEGTVITADFQRAGRGRLDRTWEAPAGSALLCSILLRPSVRPVELQWAVAAVALSARAALRARAALACGLKWPNDLVVDDRKIAGVLSERTATGALIVGVGVNLTYEGPPEARATSVLAASGEVIGAGELLDGLLQGLTVRRDLLDSVEGIAELRTEYRQALATLGRRVRVERRDGAWEGTARDVDSDGRLILDTSEGEVVVAAGDAVHVRLTSEVDS